MPEWPVLQGLDQPRPLPPDLRARLEARLGSDDLAAALASAAAPRPLAPSLRESLAGQLVAPARSRAWRRPGTAVAAAAVVVGLLGGAALLAPEQREPARLGLPGAAPTTEPSPGSALDQSGLGVVAPPQAPEAQPSNSPAPSPRGSGETTGSTPAPRPGAPVGAPAAGRADATGVTTVSPQEGPLRGGTRIVLSGSGLSDVVRVEVGGRAATDVRVESDSSVSAVTPARDEAGAVDVVAVLGSGVRHGVSPGFSYLVTPQVTSLDPSTGPVRGDNVVTITGSGFTSRIAVSFGGTRSGRVEVVSSTVLRAVVPAGLPGYVDVTVTTAGGTSMANSGSRYLYTP